MLLHPKMRSLRGIDTAQRDGIYQETRKYINARENRPTTSTSASDQRTGSHEPVTKKSCGCGFARLYLWMTKCAQQSTSKTGKLKLTSQMWTFQSILNHATVAGNKPLQSRSSAYAKNHSLSADSNNMVLAEHHMYNEGRATERENVLAEEIRNVFCTLEKLKTSHVIALAQLNGFQGKRQEFNRSKV